MPSPLTADYLFVYGTLRRDCPARNSLATSMREHLLKCAVPVGTARCRGRLYAVGDYPGLKLVAGTGTWVTGELYRVHSPGRLWPVLDHYENFDGANPSSSEYLRRRVPVQGERGPVRAWLYLYNRAVHPLRQIRSGDFCGA